MGSLLSPWAEDIQAADPEILYLLYAYDAAFYGSERRSAQLLKLLMQRGPDQGYLPNPAKSVFIADSISRRKL